MTQLTAEEITALKFAAHRQLARWASKGTRLQPRQKTRRTALISAVRTLEREELADGCTLAPTVESC